MVSYNLFYKLIRSNLQPKIAYRNKLTKYQTKSHFSIMHTSFPSPQRDFLHKFSSLSEMLVQDNYTNMKNLSYSNQNFN